MSRKQYQEDVIYVMEDQDGVARSAVLYECEEKDPAAEVRWSFFLSLSAGQAIDNHGFCW